MLMTQYPLQHPYHLHKQLCGLLPSSLFTKHRRCRLWPEDSITRHKTAESRLIIFVIRTRVLLELLEEDEIQQQSSRRGEIRERSRKAKSESLLSKPKVLSMNFRSGESCRLSTRTGRK